MDRNQEIEDAVVNELLGTSGAYNGSFCESYGISEDELYEIAAKAKVIECTTCGWWVDLDECDEEYNCEDCCQDE